MTFADLDRAVADVAARRSAWARLAIGERRRLLRACIAGTLDAADAMVNACCEAKGLDPHSRASAEEWLAGPVPTIRNLRLLDDTLADLERSGGPALHDGSIARVATGELRVRIFPRDRFDRLLYPGTRIDVWMQAGVDEASLDDTLAPAYRSEESADGGVALVLGAGNVSSIGPMDILYKLFVDRRVALLKMHPVNAYLGPVFERAFAPLIRDGYLRIVYGDAVEGRFLVEHGGVDEVHMTGSTAVHDRIVWGDTADEQASRRRDREPRITKPITSELGCVTPVIIAPGVWAPSEIAYQAEHIATMVAHNASCNCNAAKVLITWRGWPQRAVFLDAVTQALSRLPARTAYYPGAAARHAAFVGAYSQSVCVSPRTMSTSSPGEVPFATIFDVVAGRDDPRVFREEAWSPILAETSLDAADEAAFLGSAVRFCNDRVEGTLSAIVIVDPAARDRLGAGFDRAIAGLRYGTIAINHWSAFNFAIAIAPWGAYPGHTLEDVGSGIGVVHNTLMFSRTLKSVVDGPFVTRPKPAWFAGHRTAHQVASRMAGFEASPSLWRLPALALTAMRG